MAPVTTIIGAATGLSFPGGITLDSDSNIYVADSLTANTRSSLKYFPSIAVYPASSTGNAPPSAIIAGENTGLTDDSRGIALDSSRNLYTTGYVSDVGYGINVLSGGEGRQRAPAATIVGADTGLDGPEGFALDSAGNLYVANGYGGPTGDGSVTLYPAGSRGDTVPTATITSNFTGLDYPSDIATDSTGKIYVTNRSGGVGNTGSVAIYAAGSYAAGSPVATITGANTGLVYPEGVAPDSSGNIFVLNNDDAVTVYPPGSTGDVTPSATINIDGGGEEVPEGITVGPLGRLYIANQGAVKCNQKACYQTGPASVAVYPPGSGGNAKPVAVIAGPDTNLASPSAIALDRSGDIYVTNEGRKKCVPGCTCNPTGPGSITVYDPGSKATLRPSPRLAAQIPNWCFPTRSHSIQTGTFMC